MILAAAAGLWLAAPVLALDSGRCPQNVAIERDWVALKKTPSAGFWRKTIAKPRPASCYYVSWTQEEAGRRGVRTLLVFTDPAETGHPAPTKSEVFITRNLIVSSPPRVFYEAHALIWGYGPAASPSQKWGVLALVNQSQGFGAAGIPKNLQPIVWWGITRGQEFDQTDPEYTREIVPLP